MLALLAQSMLAAVHAPGLLASRAASLSDADIKLAFCSFRSTLPAEYADFPTAPPAPDQPLDACPVCALLSGLHLALPTCGALVDIQMSPVEQLNSCLEATERKQPLLRMPRSRGPPITA